MRINECTLKYNQTYVTWKDMDEKQYCYEDCNIYDVVVRNENEIFIAKKSARGREYVVLLADGTEYFSYLRGSKEAHIKVNENTILSFQDEIKDCILDELGNIYFVAGSDIYFYRRKKKLLEKICEIPEEYYFQRIEELDNKELLLVCTPEDREKFGGRDCRVGMNRNSKKLKEYGIVY